MTVAQNTPSISYAENGVTLAFAAPFRYLAADHLEVRRIVAGVETVLAYGIAWNATLGLTDVGGTVTLTATVAGATLKLRRVTPRVQQTDYVTGDSFPAETHELALDRLTMIEQEQDVAAADLSARALLVPVGETVAVLPAAAARANKFLSFNNAGAPLLVADVATSVGAAAASAAAAGVSAAAAGVSATGAAASATVAAGYATSRPFEGDNRPTEELLPTATQSRKERLRELYRDPTRSYVEAVLPVRVGKLRNLWCFTEDLTAAFYTAEGVTKQTDTLTIDGIKLTRLTASNFYHGLRTPFAGYGLTPFTAGKMYALSMYLVEYGGDVAVAFPLEQEKWFWMKDQGIGGGVKSYSQRYATNRLRRTWVVGKATSADSLDFGYAPTVAYGAGAGQQAYWFFSGQNTANVRNVYVGGFSIEEVGDDTYKDGIACIGDSTMQGSSGTDDAKDAREFTAYLAANLNVTAFNRGVGGNTLAAMVARWVTDITPLKVRSKYVIIQGGINDIVTGRTIGQMQTDLAAMVTSAATDGLIPVFLTCTPTTSIAANAAYEAQRIAYNKWLRETYRDVIDIARVVEDPAVPSKIRDDPDWTGDGIHYAQAARRAVGAFIAEWPGWEFFQPGPYQKIAGALGSYVGPTSLLEGLAGQIIGQRGAAVVDAVALTSVNATNAAAAPTMAEFNALVAEFNKLRTDVGVVRTTGNTLLARLRAGTGHGLFT